MSSDGYFEGDDQLDPSFLNALDAIEAANLLPPPKKARLLTKDQSYDYFDETFAVDDMELQRLDNFIEDTYQGKAAPVAGPSVARTTSGNMLQRTLFGGIVPQGTTSTSKTKPSSSNAPRNPPRNPFGQQARKTKVWDQTQFAKSGRKKPTNKGKGKEKVQASFEDDDEEEEWHEEEDIDFEQFPAPFVSVGPPPPMKVEADLLETKHWYYPLNFPKRDYQFNIVKHCLFENAMVALPTGLGKTFIAGVVMLNFYRWFPEGKIIFVAPTKPLVYQQIDASHKVCGIPGQDAAELTGEIPRNKRLILYQDKRVFYMTPQTLINDLATGTCDPMDIVLIVIDEAHKASGDYAYSQVIRFMMAKNPHFRVLALSATPGGDPLKVQNVIDNLHISRIEIRDESSMDLKQYIFKKEIKQHIVPMGEDLGKIRDLLADLMMAVGKTLFERNICNPVDVVKIHPYFFTAKRGELQKRRDCAWAFPIVSKMEFLARSMGYLFEASLKMCYLSLQTVMQEVADGEKKSQKSGLKTNPKFQAVMKEIDTQACRPGGWGPHPKMDMLKNLLIQHFGSSEEGEKTSAMVFAQNRGCVDEIVDVLNAEKPLIRAVQFIGQATDKQGKKGYKQKDQAEVIKKFKEGVYNVLVSTSIGEEGLDIGEIDMIICYDAQKTPVRMLQRVGRTGRKRTGYVHVLLSEVREEANWEKAKDNYGEVQKSIIRGELLELYGDVERLIPDHIKPVCVEQEMAIEEYMREDAGKKPAKGTAKTATKKRKRDVVQVPEGAAGGFVQASKLTARKKKKVKPFDPLAALSDDEDREIKEADLFALPRTTSAPVTTVTRKKATLRKAVTLDGKKNTARARKKKAVNEELVSLSQKGLDDSDDMAIEMGINAILPAKMRQLNATASSSGPHSPNFHAHRDTSPITSTASLPKSLAPLSGINSSPTKPRSLTSKQITKSPKYWTSSPEAVADADVIDISSSPPAPRINLKRSPSLPHYKGDDGRVSPSHTQPDREDRSLAWLLSDSGEEDGDLQIIDSSPLVKAKSCSPFLRPQNPKAAVDIVEKTLSLKTCIIQRPTKVRVQADESIEIIDNASIVSGSQHGSPLRPIHFNAPSSSRHQSKQSVNIPPILPTRFDLPSPVLASDRDRDLQPEPSFTFRPIGKRAKAGARPVDSESPLVNLSPPVQRRLQRKRSESPVRPQPPKKSKINRGLGVHNPWVETEAAHSGDEVSEGDVSSEDEEETEFDRDFLRDNPETQVSPSYDQSLAYRQSLFTQAPARGKAPAFGNRPSARGVPRFGGDSAHRFNSRPRPLVSSSPPREYESQDEYEQGSFVVDDDAEITWESSEP